MTRSVPGHPGATQVTQSTKAFNPYPRCLIRKMSTLFRSISFLKKIPLIDLSSLSVYTCQRHYICSLFLSSLTREHTINFSLHGTMTPYLYKLVLVRTEVYQIYRPTNSQYEVMPCKTACTALLISGSWKAIVILQKSVSSFENYYTFSKDYECFSFACFTSL